jgi:hypothetical protein
MKRTFKLNGEVSEEANDMLVAYCKKHERSKGYLIEKMIRQYCVEPDKGCVAPVESAEVVAVRAANKPKRTVFTPPTVEQVRGYCDSRCNNVDPQNFVDHYTGNGWIRGKTKVKCWKACVRTWENKDKPATKVNESLGGNW